MLIPVVYFVNRFSGVENQFSDVEPVFGFAGLHKKFKFQDQLDLIIYDFFVSHI